MDVNIHWCLSNTLTYASFNLYRKYKHCKFCIQQFQIVFGECNKLVTLNIKEII